MVCNYGCGVVIGSGRDWWEFLIVLEMSVGAEKAALISQVIGMIESNSDFMTSCL